MNKIRFIALAVCGLFVAAAAQAAPGVGGQVSGNRLVRDATPPLTQNIACGYYVISGCYRSSSSARRRARRIGGYVVNTSSRAFPNFRPGYFCAVFGPYSYGTARRKSRYIKPSYVKNGC